MATAPDSAATPRPRDPASILGHFADLPDPRREQGRIHRLDEIVFIATCAVLCGADTWVQIADYGRSKLDWLATVLELPGHPARLEAELAQRPLPFRGLDRDAVRPAEAVGEQNGDRRTHRPDSGLRQASGRSLDR